MNATDDDIIRLNDSNWEITNVSEILHKILTDFLGFTAHLNDVIPFTIQLLPKVFIVFFHEWNWSRLYAGR